MHIYPYCFVIQLDLFVFPSADLTFSFTRYALPMRFLIFLGCDRYVLKLPHDDQWGSLQETGWWTGMVGEVHRRVSGEGGRSGWVRKAELKIPLRLEFHKVRKMRKVEGESNSENYGS